MPEPTILSIPEVVGYLREWARDRRRLRVIARLGIADFSAFCVVDTADEHSFSLLIGDDPRDMFGMYLAGWMFGLGTTLPESEEEIEVGGVVETGIVGVRLGATLAILALRED